VVNGNSQFFFQRSKDSSSQRRLDFVATFMGFRDVCAQTQKLS